MEKLGRRKSRRDEAMGVSCLGMAVNILLMVIKFTVGLLGTSSALLSDAVHSGTDIFGSMVVIAGIRLSNKKSDRQHPYGHERIECVAAIILAVALVGTGLGIGLRGMDRIVAGVYHQPQIPGILALWVAIFSVLIKEGMYFYTSCIAKKTGSSALAADAWHHQSDAMASLGAFAGILGARFGFLMMDPLAGIFISMFIIKAAYDVFMDAVAKMIDEACDPEIIDEIKDIAQGVEGVIQVDVVKTRLFGNKKYVDIEISACGDKTLIQAHEIAHQVHDMVEEEVAGVKHCMVHVNPFDDGELG